MLLVRPDVCCDTREVLVVEGSRGSLVRTLRRETRECRSAVCATALAVRNRTNGWLSAERGEHFRTDLVGTALDLVHALAHEEFDSAITGITADEHLNRHAHQFVVFELRAWRHRPVVEANLHPRCLQIFIELLCQLDLFAALLVEERNDTLERRDRDRPDDALVVVMLLDRRSRGARHPDAVTAHHERRRLAVLRHERRAHRLGVLRPELEDMADLDTARLFERRPGRRVTFACPRGAKVVKLGHAGIAAEVDVEAVGEAVLVFSDESSLIDTEWVSYALDGALVPARKRRVSYLLCEAQ